MARIDKVRAGEATWGAWWLDQVGHAGLGAAWSVPTTALGTWLDWPLALTVFASSSSALTGGIGREIIQYAKSGKLHFEDRFYDAIFHVPGAWFLLAVVLIMEAIL